MEIVFRTERMKRECNDSRVLRRVHGPQREALIRRRLDQLAAASCLDEFRGLPGHCHELKGNRAGQLALDLDGAWRLVFEPLKEPSPRKPDRGLDWKAVNEVRILNVEDYHD